MNEIVKKSLPYAFNMVRVKGDLNDKSIVQVVAGLGALTCFGVGVGYFMNGGNKPRFYAGALVGTVGCGAAYLLLDTHNTKVTSGIISDSTQKPIPNYLKSYEGMNPTRRTLNQIAHDKGINLQGIIGSYFYESEIAIFFSLANTGKSIASTQMAIDIASGKRTLIPTDTPVTPQNVIYFNFEMSQAQMNKRLNPEGKGKDEIQFPDNVDMIDCNGVFEDKDEFLYYVAEMAEKEIDAHTVIFIDTITDICPLFFSKESAYFIRCLRLIQIHALKEKGIKLTFLIEAHANKIPSWEPLDLEKLKGGANQANLSDSVFALGKTIKPEQRYIKCLKYRNDPPTDEVDVFEITSKPYLHFTNVGKANEADILPQKPKATGRGTIIPNGSTADEDSESDYSDWGGKLSLEDTLAMNEFYQIGVNGRGLKSAAKKFGLKFPKEVRRELDRLNIYLETHSEI